MTEVFLMTVARKVGRYFYSYKGGILPPPPPPIQGLKKNGLKMKTTLEPEDIAAIAKEVIRELKNLLARKGSTEADEILDVQGLADLLKVSPKWIYDRTQFKEIPHYKIGGKLRFRRRDVDKWLDSAKVPAVETLKNRPRSVD